MISTAAEYYSSMQRAAFARSYPYGNPVVGGLGVVVVGGGVCSVSSGRRVWAEILVWLVRWLVVVDSLADSVVPGCGAPICYHKGGKRAKGAYQKGQVLQYCALKNRQ